MGNEKIPKKETVLKYLLGLRDNDPVKRIGGLKKLSNVVLKKQENLNLLVFPAIPDIISLLSDQSWQVKSWAARLLGNIGSMADSAVPHLVIALQDQSVTVRECAAYAIGRLGVKANSAIPLLEKALYDPHEIVRTQAHMALRNLQHKNVLSGIEHGRLVGHKVDDDFLDIHYYEVGWPRARQEADSKERIIPETGEVHKVNESKMVAGYLLRFGDANPAKRLEALKKLFDLACGNNKNLNLINNPVLRESIPLLLRDKSWQVRCWAAWFLGRMFPPLGSAIPHLAIALDDRKAAVRECSAQALGWLGASAGSSIPRLENALHDPNREVRTSAHQALRKIRRENDFSEKRCAGDELFGRRMDDDELDIHYYEVGYKSRIPPGAIDHAWNDELHKVNNSGGKSTKPEKLCPGDNVRISQHIFDEEIEYYHSYSPIIVTVGSLGTVLSVDDYYHAVQKNYTRAKIWVDEGARYPVRVMTVVPPSEYELATWAKESFPASLDCEVGRVEIIPAEFLEKITII